MPNFVKNEITSNNDIVNLYGGISKSDLDQKIDGLLKKEGYSIKQGVPGNATYEKGNQALRILLGAFHKFFKIVVLTEELENEQCRLSIEKTASGISGGLIGISQVNKELKRLGVLMQGI